MPNRPWGPSHQHMAPPRRPSWEWLGRLGGLYLLCLFAYSVVHPGGQKPFGWGLKALLVGWFVKFFAQAVLKRFSLASLWTLLTGSATAEDPVVEESEGKTPGEAVGRRSRDWAVAPTSAPDGRAPGSRPIPRAP